MCVSPIEDERPPVSSPMREKLKDKEEGKERKKTSKHCMETLNFKICCVCEQ